MLGDRLEGGGARLAVYNLNLKMEISMNRKLFGLFTVLFLLSAGLYAQSDDDFFTSEEDMFSSGDNMFSNDDDLFGDNGIEDVDDVKPKSDLSKGFFFDSGSIKIGGNFSTSLSTMTTLYSEENKSFADNLKDTKLTPTASALLSVDARPTQELRMYTKFGVAYPTKTTVAGISFRIITGLL